MIRRRDASHEALMDALEKAYPNYRTDIAQARAATAATMATLILCTAHSYFFFDREFTPEQFAEIFIAEAMGGYRETLIKTIHSLVAIKTKQEPRQ